MRWLIYAGIACGAALAVVAFAVGDEESAIPGLLLITIGVAALVMDRRPARSGAAPRVSLWRLAFLMVVAAVAAVAGGAVAFGSDEVLTRSLGAVLALISVGLMVVAIGKLRGLRESSN